MGEIRSAEQTCDSLHRESATWQEDLVRCLDKASMIAEAILKNPESQDPPELLQKLIDGLAHIETQVMDDSLAEPGGQAQLGVAHVVTDCVDGLDGQLHHAVCEIERQ
jgi:hypothetical protein